MQKIPEQELKKKEEVLFQERHNRTIFETYLKMRMTYISQLKDDEEKKKKLEDELKQCKEDNILRFESMQEALGFFNQQAELKQEFFCVEITAEGKHLNNYIYSCGDGSLYKGTIEIVKQQLEERKAELTKDNKTKDNENYDRVSHGLRLIQAYMHKKISRDLDPELEKDVTMPRCKK